jgi:muramoyltetrapeptide carboxypeptidase
MILPPPLRPGDCIGIFSPSGPVRDQAKVDAGIRVLHEMGFQTKQAPCRGTGCDYLAADDQARADTFHALLADDEVHALIALRGGFGCLRMLELIDFGMVESCRKYIIGFSDVSVLLNVISLRTGLVTLHGPVLTSLAGTDRQAVVSLLSLLTGGLPDHFSGGAMRVLRPGKGAGVLRGGNLTSLVHLLGTPWEIPASGSVLLLEDTGETMYRLDRMLTQLYHAGKFHTLSGIVLGSFDAGDNPDKNRLLQEQVWKRVLDLTRDMDYPVWGNYPVGHGKKNRPLPLGADVVMDSSSAGLRLQAT